MSFFSVYGATIVLACLLSSVAYRLYIIAKDPLRSIPGPFLARFTRLWLLSAIHRGDWEKVNIKLHRKYGPVVRVGPNMYSICDRDATSMIYSAQHSLPKSDFYHVFGIPGVPNVLSAPSNKQAGEIRKKYKPSYDAFVSYEYAVDDCSHLLTDQLSDFAATGKQFDLGWWLTCYAFDVNGMIAFSKRFGHLDKGEDIGGIYAALEERMGYISHIGLYAWLHPYLYKLITLMVFITKKIDYMVVFAEKHIADHQRRAEEGGKTGAPDMLDRYVALHERDPSYFTYNDLLMGACTSIAAGADTTWISLGGIMRYLHQHPETLQKLRSEIDEMSRQGKISDPVTWEESLTMPYLNAVIREALRMHTPVGLHLWRVVPESGITLCGNYFPPGATVGVNPWVAHYSPTFDPDPDTFRPERWLEADKDHLTRLNASFMPFGMGPRICQGQYVALMEMNKIIPQLIRKFDFDLNLDWKTSNYWMVRYSGLIGTVRPRENFT